MNLAVDKFLLLKHTYGFPSGFRNISVIFAIKGARCGRVKSAIARHNIGLHVYNFLS